MTWEAPLRYERWMFSFAGDGGRNECWPSEGRRLADQGSGDAGIGGGVSTGGLPLVSESESAWKNLDSVGTLPTADSGGEGTVGEGVGASWSPLA